jgi:hypothetical protein
MACGHFGRHILQAMVSYVQVHIWERGVWAGFQGVCSLVRSPIKYQKN